TYDVRSRISSIHISAKFPGIVFLVVPVKYKKPGRLGLVSLKLPAGVEQLVEAKEFSTVIKNVSPDPKCIAFGQGGEYIAYVRDNLLLVYFFKKAKFYTRNFNWGKDYTFSTVHWHHSGPTIDDSVAMTPFYLLLGKHRKQQQEEGDTLSRQ
ncbi:hypothetical protein CRUP_020657, partial [Coryphaenoides rupestris]